MEDQPDLLRPEHLAPRLRWQRLFEFLPPWPQAPAQQGRKPCDRSALLKATIYQRLTRRRFLQDLRRHLLESPPSCRPWDWIPISHRPAWNVSVPSGPIPLMICWKRSEPS